MDNKSSVKITYETLFEILMREKNREELQKLDDDFVENVIAYLNKKSQFLKKDNQGLSSFIEHGSESILNELHNIQKIIKEIYNRREKKIIEMAINLAKSPNMLIDTSNCLDYELKLLYDLKNVLRRYRIEILEEKIFQKKNDSLKEDDLNKNLDLDKGKEIEKLDEKELNKNKELENEHKNENNLKEENEINIKNSNTEEFDKRELNKKFNKIKFIKDVPEIYDSELNCYGPFKSGDKINFLPEELIELLEEQGSIELIKE